MEKSNYTEIWVNCDETQWTILPKRASTWAKTNTDNIYISCSDNDKEAITALCTIQGVPEFKKLPLFLIGKDQTENGKKKHHFQKIYNLIKQLFLTQDGTMKYYSENI